MKAIHKIESPYKEKLEVEGSVQLGATRQWTKKKNKCNIIDNKYFKNMRKVILVLMVSLFAVSAYAQIEIFNAEGKLVATVDGDGYVVSRFNDWEKLGRVSPKNM